MTDCGCGLTNSSRKSCAVLSIVAGTPKKEQLTLTHVNYYCYAKIQQSTGEANTSYQYSRQRKKMISYICTSRYVIKS